MAARLTDYQVLTFDCYGTLIDWESGIWLALQPLLRWYSRHDIDRAEVRALRERRGRPPGPVLLGHSRARARGHRRPDLGATTTPDLDADFGASISHWPAFSDTAAALGYLQTRFKLVILSNVHREGFAASQRHLGIEFDAIYTAEDIGSYKPAAANFEYMIEHVHSDFGLKSGQILHTAQSLYHDHVPARAVGLANAWIDRQRLSAGGDWGATTRVMARPETDFVFLLHGRHGFGRTR